MFMCAQFNPCPKLCEGGGGGGGGKGGGDGRRREEDFGGMLMFRPGRV
jgi:hypothetical protein